MAAPRRRAKPRRRLPAMLVLLVVVIVATLVVVTRFGGADGSGSSADDTSQAGDRTTPSASSSPPPPPPVRPRRGQCRDLTYDAAIATSDATAVVPCSAPHTAITIAVEQLPRARTRARVEAGCRREAAGFLGGTAEQRELSMLQVVWFVPTDDEIEAGADWYRCDVIALRSDARLQQLTGRLRDVVTGPGAARYAMCGTAAPGTDGFSRVICAGPHRWRAVEIVPLAGTAGPRGRYPGVGVVRERGQEQCQNAGQDAADDPLDFQWGYEWPTAEQWSAGQTYGICWVPA